jgi:signal transduction histidine kinase
VADERLRIARELHDVMGHTIAAITVQAGLAVDVLDDSPEQARRALAAIRAASREAMAEIKATVGVLRADGGGAAPLSPAPGLDQIRELVSATKSTGLSVEVVRIGEPRPLPAAVDTTAYRIVQESLTNVVRHAGATHASVRIRYEPAALGIEVADDGIGGKGSLDPGPAERRGYGIVGMTERASTLGGWLRAGPGPGGGFLVEARLPLEGSSS